VACLVDPGRVKDVPNHRPRDGRAVEALAIDAKEEFAEHYCLPALMANALYEDKYPLVSSLSRPLIAKKLVQTAHAFGATAVAHGCTGKGNDQVRIDVGVRAIPPEIIARRAAPTGQPRGAARLRRRPRHPLNSQEEPLLHRREPLGTQQRVRGARGSLGGAA
jgi:argininosuccinate synthase